MKRDVLLLDRMNKITSEFWTGDVADYVLGTRVIYDKMMGLMKPSRYYNKPIISFRVPTTYIIRSEIEDAPIGIGILWKTINIGKRKLKNLNYKLEMKEWKESQNTVISFNENNLRWTPKPKK